MRRSKNTILHTALNPIVGNAVEPSRKKSKRLAEDIKKELGKPAQEIQTFIDKIAGPGRVKVQVVPKIDANGLVVEGVTVEAANDGGRMRRGMEQLIKISGDLVNGDVNAMRSVAAHEVVHALRNAGLMNNREWKALAKKALTHKVPGKSYTFTQAAQARVKGVPGGNQHVMEEAIAEMVRHYADNPLSLDKPSRSLLQKIFSFITKLAGLTKRYDGDDVIRSLLGGEFADREIGSGVGRTNYPGQVFFSSVKVPEFYLKTDKFLEKVTQKKGKPQQWLAMIKKQGQVSDEELDWLALPQWLEDQENRTIEIGELRDYVRSNALEVKERVGNQLSKSEEKRMTILLGDLFQAYEDDFGYNSLQEWLDWQLEPVAVSPFRSKVEEFQELREKKKGPVYHHDTTQHGGTDYTEVLLHIPTLKPPFSEFGHFDEFQNIIASARFKTRDYGDGKKVLFIEEIQSDLHQKGKKKGYFGEEYNRKLSQLNELEKKYDEAIRDHRNKRDEMEKSYFARSNFEEGINEKYGIFPHRDMTYEENKKYSELERDYILKKDRFTESFVEVGDLKKSFESMREDIQREFPGDVIPDAPFKTTWSDLAFKRLVRWAVDNDFDAVAWHGDADSVAMTQNYGELTVVEDDDATRYTVGDGGPDVTGIVDFYTKRLKNTASKYFKKFNAYPQYIDPSAILPEDYDFAKLIPNQIALDGFMYEAKHLGMNDLYYQLRLVSQATRNQRDFDIIGPLSQSDIDPDEFYSFIRNAVGNPIQDDVNGNPEVPRWQMDITPEMVESLLENGMPYIGKFSAVSTDRTNINPLYSATAPMGQRVPIHAPADHLEEIEYKTTYNNLAPVFKKINKILPNRMRATFDEGVEDTFIALQDKMLPLGQLIDRIKSNGGYITNESDTYLQDTLFSGQTEAEIEANDRNYYTPLMDAVKELPVVKADVEAAKRLNESARSILEEYPAKPKTALAELYVYAQHAKERNRVMRERNEPVQNQRREQYEAGSGMTDVEADQILNWFVSKPFGEKFYSLNDPFSIRSLYRKLIANTNDVRAQGGLNPDFRLLTTSTGQPANMFEDYAPIRGFIEEHLHPDHDAETFARTGQGYNIRGSEDRSAIGRSSLGANLIGTAIFQNEEAVIRAGKNKVGQSFLKLLRDNPELMSEIAEIIESRPSKWSLIKSKGVVQKTPDLSFANDPMVLTVKENTSEDGLSQNKETYIRFKDKRVAEAMKSKSGFGQSGLGPVVKALHTLNRFVGSMSTTYNPEFLFSNFLRDLQQAQLNLGEQEVRGLHKDIIKTIVPSIRAIYRAQKNNDMSDPWMQVYNEFRSMGAMTSVMGLQTLEDSVVKMNNHIMEDHSGIPNKIKDANRAAEKFYGPIRDFIANSNLAVENGVRLAAYKRLRDHFLTLTNDPNDPKNIRRAKERAAFIAKELTVNFNRGGKAKPYLNSLYLFYNASMQGSMALINPLIRSKKVRRMWAGVIAGGVMQDMIMAALSGEDDDGALIYDKIPDYILEHNMILPDILGTSERGYYKIPLPYMMNGVWNAGRSMSRAMRGGYTMGEAMKTSTVTMAESLSPFGALNSFANFVAPTVMDPIIDLSQNKDFANRPISPPESQYGVGVVGSQRYWNNTNPAYVAIADWLHKLSGGDGDYMPGLAEWSPNQIQFVMEFALGGAGAFANRLYNFSPLGEADIVGAVLRDEDFSYNDVPFVRRLVGNVSTREDLAYYIDNRDRILRVKKELDEAREAGNSERYLSVMKRYPSEYRVSQQVKKIESQRLKLGRMIKEVRDAKHLTDEEKRERIQSLKEQQDELISLGNAIMRRRGND
jgi:hypothetical protein